MNLKKILFYLMFLFVLMFAVACSNDSSSNEPANNEPEETETETETETEEPAEEPEQPAEVVNIGYTGPLSGPAAFYGENTLSGLQMATEEINGSGGFEVNGQKYEINLVALDDKYLPNEAGTNAKRLVQENNTPIIFVPHSGGIFAMQVFNEVDNFIVGAYSSEPAIT